MRKSVLTCKYLEYLAHLFHQILLIVQTACCVDDEHIRVPGLCRLDRIVDHRTGISAFRACDDRDICPLSPHVELLDCTRTERIRCSDQNLLALFSVEISQFSDSRRFTDSVNADHKKNGFLVFKCKIRFVHSHLFLDGIHKELLTFRSTSDVLFLHLLLQVRDDLIRCSDSHVGHDHGLFQILIELVINLVIRCKDLIYTCRHVISCFGKAFYQLIKKSHNNLRHPAYPVYRDRSSPCRISQDISKLPVTTTVYPRSGSRTREWRHLSPAS